MQYESQAFLALRQCLPGLREFPNKPETQHRDDRQRNDQYDGHIEGGVHGYAHGFRRSPAVGG